MEDNKQAIMDKIAKLLTLSADQSGKPEGETARLMASKLMAKYRIAESEIDLSTKSGSDIFNDEDGWSGMNDEHGMRQWVADLGSNLAKTFDCRMWMSSHHGTIHFVGTAGDIETCLYFMDVVYGHIEREARRKLPLASQRQKRNIFGQAAIWEVSARLLHMEIDMRSEMKKVYSGGSDLMIIKNDLVEKTYSQIQEEFGLKLVKRKDLKVSENHRDIILAGQRAGKTAPLNKAISN